MSFTDDTAEQSPFRRPRFIIAAAVIAVIAILGIVIGVVNATRDENPDPTPVPAPAAEAAAAPDGEDEDTDSVCGLDGAVTGPARLTSAPAVDRWDYQGTTAYPVSGEYGPAAVDPAGFRYCYQHSPEGALFAAAYALAVGSDQALAAQWIEYFTAPGPYRDQLTSDPGATTDDGSAETTRMNVAGFRLLSYDGTTARVDLGVTGASQGTPFTASVVYDLVWSEGDWKVDTNTAEPFNFAVIPDLAGYVQWESE